MSETALQRLTTKQTLWFQYYTDRANRKTFLNATQSAIAANNYELPRQYATARQMGSEVKKTCEARLDKWLEEEGFSERALKTSVLDLMVAHETKFIKVKGAIREEDLPPGASIVCVSGVVHEAKDDKGVVKDVYSTGETLVALEVQDKGIQRAGRDMGLRVKGMYAADKVDVTGLEGLSERLTKARARNDKGGGDSVFD